MKIKDVGFRALYHRFVVIEINDHYKETLNLFPGIADASCALTYGYFDSMAGISFEVLEVGKHSDEGFVFFGGVDDVSCKFRLGAVDEQELICPGNEEILIRKHNHKIKGIHHFYSASQKVEETRSLTILDEFRYDACPDDVLVILIKQAVKPEKCWVTITDMKEKHFYGKLLNEPFADFGVHQGDIIQFHIGKDQNQKPLLYSLLA